MACVQGDVHSFTAYMGASNFLSACHTCSPPPLLPWHERKKKGGPGADCGFLLVMKPYKPKKKLPLMLSLGDAKSVPLGGALLRTFVMWCGGWGWGGGGRVGECDCKCVCVCVCVCACASVCSWESSVCVCPSDDSTRGSYERKRTANEIKLTLSILQNHFRALN